MDDQNISDIQKSILDILEYFDDFCREKQIPYFIIGGTLLGAVRHGGFIPWDDDIDIGVPRPAYDRLVSMAKEISPPYQMENYDINPENYFPFIKIYNTKTVALEDMVKPMQRGVWIDVFPLDGTFNSSVLIGIHIKIMKFMKRLVAYRAGGYTLRDKRSYEIQILRILSLLLKLIPSNMYYAILSHVARWRDFNNSRNVGNLFGYWGVGEIVPRNLFEKATPISFESMHTFGPLNPDIYLKSVYGDYMKLPPLEKRYGHKFKEIRLDIYN